MPNFNNSAYISPAIRSILSQSYSDLELIIVDDGSSDSSLDIIREFAAQDSRIVLLEMAHGGLVRALNAGVRHARGQFIARMDADDISFPERIEKQVAFLRHSPDVVAVGSWAIFICPAATPLYAQASFSEHDRILDELRKGHGSALIHPTVMIRTETVSAIGGYREVMTYSEDYDAYLRLAEVGKLANIPEPLLLYRVHPKSVSHSSRMQQHAFVIRAIQDAAARRPDLWGDSDISEFAPFSTPVGALVEWARIASVRGRGDLARTYCVEAFRRKKISRQVMQLVMDLLLNTKSSRQRSEKVAARGGAFGEPLTIEFVRRAYDVQRKAQQ
jgi:glycosyltransferase involved in cell wall biosynthesis